MSRICDGFQSHAFLRNKCRDCSRTEEEHKLYQSGNTEEEDTKTQNKQDNNGSIEARPQSIAIEAHQHAFDHIDVLSPSNVLTSTLLCKKFQPHAWITDRCQDWSVESIKDTNEKLKPVQALTNLSRVAYFSSVAARKRVTKLPHLTQLHHILIIILQRYHPTLPQAR